MIKRILQFLMLLSVCISAHSQAVEYNAIATAYVTTTISQNVVFDSTMQQGGTFTFSVLAHNGGGRAGQSDTANVRIQFFNSSGQQIGATAQTNYSGNLPNPNASAGNPAIDTSVPWSTLTVSATLSSTDAANVAYAKVSMYGIDGSYWAGDYGPWYRAPTFQHNGSGNLTYNPEFGPYNGITAQGWTSSPGFGACQGAWGGSNACIVNSDGVPGSSTVGLVANANGGGPSATGGTTSGQAGGYNNTMTVTNAGTGATAGAPSTPPPPTVTGTTVTYTTRQVVNGNTTTVYRTPVTTTNYSDGTSTSSNGTETVYQTKVASTVVTNTIVGTTLTTISTPINTVTTSGTSGTTVESNGNPTSTSQTIQRGLNFQVWRYDPKNYSCFLGLCTWNLTYHTPSTNINSYGNTVNSGVTTNGMFLQTNARLPNGDGSLLGYNEGTVIRYTGTITAPITTAHPAGSVYRLYFYNQTDDGFVLNINGTTVINNSEVNQWQAIGNNYNSNGWLDVVAGQTYNLEAWYWNVAGGVGHRFFWDYGDGIRQVTNSAFTTGNISNATVDTTGVAYSNSSVVNIAGSAVTLGPVVEGGTITQNNSPGDQTIGSGSSYIPPGDFDAKQTRVNTWTNNTQPRNNELYIEQTYGTNNTVSITQSGQKNRIDFTMGGNNNIVNNTQTGSNYLKEEIPGWGNNITINQSNTSLTNYAETKIQGNGNTVNHTQTGPGNHILFNVVTGDINTVNSTQTGNAGHYLDVKLTGNHNSVISNQSGNTANKANIDLTNAGGAASVDLGQTGGKNFTIIQSCVNPAGCSTTVRQ